MADPDFSNVALLLSLNGSNGSLSLTDTSSHADSKTIVDGAELTTARAKFGSASLALAWPGADVPAWSHSRFDRASGSAYTIEGWVYLPSGSSTGATIAVWELQDICDLYYDEALPGLAISVQSGATYDQVVATQDQWLFVQFRVLTDNTWAVRLDGTIVSSGTGLGAWSGKTFRVASHSSGANSTPAIDMGVDDVRVTPGIARSTTVPTAEFETGPVSFTAFVSAAGPLSAPEIVAVADPMAFVVDTGPLGAPAVLVGVELRGLVQDTGPLGSMLAVVQHDFTSFVGSLKSKYVMDITTPDGTVRVPISSWQATLQTEGQCYVQCVVPACSPYVDDLNDATAFAIFRRVVLASGYAVEGWMAGAEITNLQFARGSANYSATVSGYSDAFTADDDPPESLDRVMTGVRMIASSNGVSRASCDIDWLLRPGMRAYVDEDPLLVGWINYYVNESGEYMDVGESSAAG